MSKKEVRRNLDLPESSRIILFGADNLLNERKGFKYLLDALQRLPADKDRDTILLTFGYTPQNESINIKFPIRHAGALNDESRIAMVYNAADVYVIPSLNDNLPNTVIEALACGIPVVGFNIGGIPDMIEHKINGYLAEPRNTGDLVSGIEWVFSAYKKNYDFMNRCRRKTENHYAMDIQAKVYSQLYEQLRASTTQEDAFIDAMRLNKEGELLFESGKFHEALNNFQQALQVYPDYYEVYNNMGVYYWNMGDEEKAFHCFENVIRNNPLYKPAVLNYAKALIESGQKELALEICNAYLELNPVDPDIIDCLR